MKSIYLIILMLGYTFNMYFLVLDEEIRSYQWVNKVGIVIIPLGSVMGYIYYIDKSNILNFNIQVNK